MDSTFALSAIKHFFNPPKNMIQKAVGLPLHNNIKSPQLK